MVADSIGLHRRPVRRSQEAVRCAVAATGRRNQRPHVSGNGHSAPSRRYDARAEIGGGKHISQRGIDLEEICCRRAWSWAATNDVAALRPADLEVET